MIWWWFTCLTTHCFFSGNGLCSCCVSDPMGLSFLPPYGCQGNRTASVAALRMKAREHSEAVLQSANLLSAATGPGASVGVLSGVGVSAAGVARPSVGPAVEVPSAVARGGERSSPSPATKVPVLGGSPDKHPHCSKDPLEKKWGAGLKGGCTDTLNLCDRACYCYSTVVPWATKHNRLTPETAWERLCWYYNVWMQTLKYLFDSKLLLFMRNTEYLGALLSP